MKVISTLEIDFTKYLSSESEYPFFPQDFHDLKYKFYHDLPAEKLVPTEVINFDKE